MELEEARITQRVIERMLNSDYIRGLDDELVNLKDKLNEETRRRITAEDELRETKSFLRQRTKQLEHYYTQFQRLFEEATKELWKQGSGIGKPITERGKPLVHT